ncbi:MAG: hypothetical protein GY819_16605 [Planctomycetaceae bacterium]|nr:hypothetical protein [Planctomycetaceae bacterium]
METTQKKPAKHEFCGPSGLFKYQQLKSLRTRILLLYEFLIFVTQTV